MPSGTGRVTAWLLTERGSWEMRWCTGDRLGDVAEGMEGSKGTRMAFGGCWEVVGWDGDRLGAQVEIDRGC